MFGLDETKIKYVMVVLMNTGIEPYMVIYSYLKLVSLRRRGPLPPVFAFYFGRHRVGWCDCPLDHVFRLWVWRGRSLFLGVFLSLTVSHVSFSSSIRSMTRCSKYFLFLTPSTHCRVREHRSGHAQSWCRSLSRTTSSDTSSSLFLAR